MKTKQKRRKPHVTMRIGNPGEEVLILVPGTTIEQAQRNATRFRKDRLKNIAEGFYDSTGFHPIRKAKDYDPTKVRAGGEAKHARAKLVAHALGHGGVSKRKRRK